MTTPPTIAETGPVWVTGDTLNTLGTAITERTLKIAQRWQRVLRLTEKPEGLELEVDVDQLLKEYGKEIFYVKDGVAVKGRFLTGEATPV